MTDFELRQIEERSCALTGWTWDEAPDRWLFVDRWGWNGGLDISREVKEFIDSARRDIPRLVAEIRELRRHLERLAR